MFKSVLKRLEMDFKRMCIVVVDHHPIKSIGLLEQFKTKTLKTKF